MSAKTKKILKKEYDRLKKAVERLLKPGRGQRLLQPVLQPVRNTKYFEGY